MGNKKLLKVRMLGDFTMEYEGKVFTIERNNSTKVNQLLQILLYYNSGIPRAELLEHMFNDELITNPSNSLRALVFRLRKALVQGGVPDDEFVHISRGVYSWTRNIELSCDAHYFEEKANLALSLADSQSKKAELEEALVIYRGEFLPELVGIDWATVISTRLKKLFNRCLKELLKIYEAEAEYDRILVLSKKAIGMYPLDGWQTYEMKALIALGNQKEAMKLYENTEALMLNELGVSVSESMKQLLEQLGSQFSYSSDNIATVQKNLDSLKKDEDGAFFCSFPIFTESYRYMKRVIKRNGMSAWLVLCTITDGKGYSLDASDRLGVLSDELSIAIGQTLRGGDMYTKYSESQYLIFVLGTTKEDCAVIEERIVANMDKASRKRYVKFNLAPVNENSASSTAEDEFIQIVRGIE